MASDLDTVRVLRALFNDMPRAPQGLSPEETLAWVQRSMDDFDGGDMAYMLEHITRSSMLDIVLRLREDGYLKDDIAFEERQGGGCGGHGQGQTGLHSRCLLGQW